MFLTMVLLHDENRSCEEPSCRTRCSLTFELIRNKALRLYLHFQNMELSGSEFSCEDFEVKALVDDVLVQCLQP